MKLSRKNASEFANIFEIRKPKLRKKKFVYIFQKYGKFEAFD